MTDAAFNRWLAQRVRYEIPGALDDDPHVEIRDGVPMIIFGIGRIDMLGMSSLGGTAPARAAAIVAMGLTEAAHELSRRMFE